MTGVKRKVSWCDTPPEALSTSGNIKLQHTKKDKRSIKPFVKEIEKEHVTKTISSYLSVKVLL